MRSRTSPTPLPRRCGHLQSSCIYIYPFTYLARTNNFFQRRNWSDNTGYHQLVTHRHQAQPCQRPSCSLVQPPHPRVLPHAIPDMPPAIAVPPPTFLTCLWHLLCRLMHSPTFLWQQCKIFSSFLKIFVVFNHDPHLKQVNSASRMNVA